MPIRDIIIPETSSMILDPISKEITLIVLTRLGMNKFFGDNIYITNDYTKTSLTNDSDTHNALISKDRCDVKMTASMNPTEMKWDINSFKYTQAYGVIGVHDKPMKPIFVDRSANVYAVEHQLPCTMTLEFSLQFKDREAAFSTISTINNTSLKDSVINYHDLVYEYPVGVDLTYCLSQIFELRKVALGTMTFAQYLQGGSNMAIQYIQSRTKNERELVIKRQDIQAYGVLEYNETAPGIQEQDSSMDRFVVNFTYTIQFARPDVLRLYFPTVVENQMVPKWMLRVQEQNYLAQVYGAFQEKSITGYLRNNLSNIPVVVRLPEYDDFRPPAKSPAILSGFAEFFDAILLLDTPGPTVVDMMDLGTDIELNPIAVEIMKLHGQEIFQTTGLYNVAVYCNDLPVDPSCLSIDSNLVVTVNMTNLSKRYHFVISEAQNIGMLSRKWMQTLIQYRTFFPVTIIKNLNVLISKGYCYIDHHNKLLQLIQYQIHNLSIDTIIATLISAGHLNQYAYCFATTAEQFADYLMNITSPCSGRLAYDEYVDLCVQQNLIARSDLATGYIKGKNGYPFLPENVRGAAGTYFNLPFRVQQTVVKTHKGVP
jgi:hypothetical protein